MTSHKQAWTKGPWRIGTKGNLGNTIEAQSGKASHEFDDGYRVVATFQDCCKTNLYAELEANRLANGNLISAAPAMYEALKAALCELSACSRQLAELGRNSSPNGSVDRAIKSARAALKTAGGEE
jgi:hypothetical protein